MNCKSYCFLTTVLVLLVSAARAKGPVFSNEQVASFEFIGSSCRIFPEATTEPAPGSTPAAASSKPLPLTYYYEPPYLAVLAGDGHEVQWDVAQSQLSITGRVSFRIRDKEIENAARTALLKAKRELEDKDFSMSVVPVDSLDAQLIVAGIKLSSIKLDRPFDQSGELTLEFELPDRYRWDAVASTEPPAEVLKELRSARIDFDITFDAQQSQRDRVTVMFKQAALAELEQRLNGGPGKSVAGGVPASADLGAPELFNSGAHLVTRDEKKKFEQILSSGITIIGIVENQSRFDAELGVKIAEALMLKDVTLTWGASGVETPGYDTEDLKPDRINKAFASAFKYDATTQTYSSNTSGGAAFGGLFSDFGAQGSKTKQEMEDMLRQRGLVCELIGEKIIPKKLEVSRVSVASIDASTSFTVDNRTLGAVASYKRTVLLRTRSDRAKATKPVAESQNILRNAIGVPLGTILMWSGPAGNIPAGWVVCDGRNETPDLRNRFVLGADPGAPMGAPLAVRSHGEPDTHSHSVQLPEKSYQTTKAGKHTHGLPGLYLAGVTAHDAKPEYLGPYQPATSVQVVQPVFLKNDKVMKQFRDQAKSSGASIVGSRGFGIGEKGKALVKDTESRESGEHDHMVAIALPEATTAKSEGENKPRWYALLYIMKIE